MPHLGYITANGGPHDCGPYCEHPGQNGVHESCYGDTPACFTQAEGGPEGECVCWSGPR